METENLYHTDLLSGFETYQQQRKIFQTLSEALTDVRSRNDLTAMFSSELSKTLGLQHLRISLLLDQGSGYTTFCCTSVPETGLSGDEPGNIERLKEQFIGTLLGSKVPVPFLIDERLELPAAPEYLLEYAELGLTGGLAMPLKSKEAIIGFVQFFSDLPEQLKLKFSDLIESISPQISNAIANIQLNEEIQNKIRTNKRLIDLSNDLVSVRHKKDLLNALNNGLRKVFPFSHSAVVLADEITGYYTAFLTQQDNPGRDLTKFSTALSELNSVEDDLYRVAAGTHSPVIFNSETVNLKLSPLWYRFNYALGTRETLIKVLSRENSAEFALLFFSNHPGAFNKDFIGFIERISDQLLNMLRNINTNEKLQKREQEKTFLLDFSNDVAQVRNIKDLSQVTEKWLGKLGPVRMYALSKINTDQQTLSYIFHSATPVKALVSDWAEIARERFAIADGWQDRILSGSLPFAVNTGEEQESIGLPKYIRLWNKMGLKHVMGYPLRAGETRMGILWVDIEAPNVDLLKGMSALLSIALSNIIADEEILKCKRNLEIENKDLNEQIKTFYDFSEIIGTGTEIRKIYSLINIVAPSDTTVLITGETGTGKELIARAIHNSSARNQKSMVKVNCAALPADLIESELFGHEKGSFTGASDRHIGKFELADEGTIFLDEIGEMPLDLQAKLLRVLQEQELERVGGNTTIKINVRIIAATNRDLQAEINAGRFRADLFYRLNVFPMQLPPLRARIEDIKPLAEFFIVRYSKLSGMETKILPEALIQKMYKYSWPGNIRELEHFIERSVLMSPDRVLAHLDLPENRDDVPQISWQPTGTSLQEAERAYIIDVLKGCSGKISGTDGAASLLGLPASTLHSKMKKLGIAKKHYLIN